jgi:cbb3-type cytochrome oxidase subunit 3
MCYVFEHELKTIGSANTRISLDIGLFGVSFGALIAFLITVFTVEILSPFVFATFWGLVVLFSLSTAFFFIRYLISRKESSQEVNRILEESRNREPESII